MGVTKWLFYSEVQHGGLETSPLVAQKVHGHGHMVMVTWSHGHGHMVMHGMVH
jgi:hypothetical protein